MIDFPVFSLIMMFAFVGMVIVFSVFKWGYEKEKRGERTDIFGRKNNNMPEEDMD